MGGSEFTLQMSLPQDPAVREARLKQLCEAAVQGGKFLIATRDGAWRITASRFKRQSQVKLPHALRQSQDPFFYCKVMGGNKVLIMQEVLRILKSPVPEVQESAKSAQKPAAEAKPVATALVDPWGRHLPQGLAELLKDVSLDRLDASGDNVFPVLSRVWGSVTELSRDKARMELLKGNYPVATILMACDPAHKAGFAKYLDILQGRLWNDLVDAAIKRLVGRSAAEQVDATSIAHVRTDTERWFDPLPEEFRGVDVEKLTGKHTVLAKLRDLRNGDYYAERFFSKPRVVLSAVVHIDRNQSFFRGYQDVIRPRWNAWLQTARKALPGR